MGSRKLRIGATIHGVGSQLGAWRLPNVPVDASVNPEFYMRQAKIAESGKLDFVFIADNPYTGANASPHMLNRFEPVTILSALATVTSHIGLVGTISTTYSEPYTVARQLASLDLISKGRAGWNVVTSGLEGAAQNYGKDAHLEHDARYRMAQEHIDVVRGLWDSWEDDAFIRDKQSGVFFDPDKLHELNHEGAFFKVRGPLNVARSRQGQPVIFQAGGSDAGKTLAASRADAIFATGTSLESLTAFVGDVKRRAVAAGRSPDEVLVFPGINPIIGQTEAEVGEKIEALKSLIGIEEAIRELGTKFSYHDFSQYGLDDPFPELGNLGENSYRSVTDRIKQVARERKFTLREAALFFAMPNVAFAGTPLQVADTIQLWFERSGTDGFMIGSVFPGDGLNDFVTHVVPILQERGLFRTDYGHPTLRGQLGLEIPVNRHAAAQSAI